MKISHDHIGVRVPATSANLGPGFDSMGIALGLYDDIEVWATTGGSSVTVSGHGAGMLPEGEDHLVIRAVRAGLDHVGAPQVGLTMRCHNRIPHGQGLGSSAAAVVGGLTVARGLIGEDRSLDDATMLRLASQFEGHPDNAAPAILGGATLAWWQDKVPYAVGLQIADSLSLTLLVPDNTLETATARAVLPELVPHADAAFNAAHAALLVEAIRTRPDLLFSATEDRLHQRYRAEVFPDSYALVTNLRSQGKAAVVSGAGPAVLVLGDGDNEIMAREGWTVINPTIDRQGVQLWRL